VIKLRKVRFKKHRPQSTTMPSINIAIVFLIFVPDVFALLMASIASYNLRFASNDFSQYQDSLVPGIDYLFILAGLSAGWMVALGLSGSYQFRIVNYARFNQYKLIRTSVTYFFFIGFTSFSLNASFSRQLFLSMFFLGLFNILLVRLMVYLFIIKKIIQRKKVSASVLVIGIKQESIDLYVDWIIENRNLGYKVLGSMKCDRIDFEWIAEFDERRSRLRDFEVLLLPGIETDKNFPKFIHYLEDLGIHINWIPLDSGNLGFWLVPSRQEGLPFLTFQKSQISAQKRAIKRIFDIAFSVVFLIFSFPIFVVISLAILISDGRPIFYSQTRIGQNGTQFRFLKFRTMVTDAEKLVNSVENTLGSSHVLFKNKSDPRVTKIGKILRKYSLDEFPQFFNILIGDMSVVGPRPALPREVGIYSSLYERRLLAKPGITGPWQISGRSDLDLQTSIALDLNYLINWSFISDLWIIFATIGVVIKGKGAY
jgi:exopolysaccharide biosynthesis polyprenyl glycosylphosphotransferase